MMARTTSLADQYRAHRAAFTLALELGCTPKEAEQELRRRAAQERERECLARMAQRDSGIQAERPRMWWQDQ